MSLFGKAVLSLALALPALPAPVAAQRLPVEVGRWNLDYGNVRCSLSRRLGGPQSPILTLSSYLGRDEPEIILMRDGSEELPDLRGAVEVVLGPDNHVARGVPRSRQVQGGRIITVQELEEGFIDRFAASRSVRFQSRGRQVFELPIPGATAAVAALRACNEELLQSWGVDTSVEVSRRPRILRGSITNADYPNESIRAGEQGAVVTRFLVGTDGRASNCGIAVSSGSRRLDGHTCALLVERMRFEPARDAQDRPVTGLFVQTVRWMMPD